MNGNIYISRLTIKSSILQVSRKPNSSSSQLISTISTDNDVVAEEHIKRELVVRGISTDPLLGDGYYVWGDDLVDIVCEILQINITKYYTKRLIEHYKQSTKLPGKSTMERFWLDTLINKLKKHPRIPMRDRGYELVMLPLLTVYMSSSILPRVKLPTSLCFMISTLCVTSKKIYTILCGDITTREYNKLRKNWKKKIKRQAKSGLLPDWARKWCQEYVHGLTIPNTLTYLNPYGLVWHHLACYKYYELKEVDSIDPLILEIIKEYTRPTNLTYKQRKFFQRLYKTSKYKDEADTQWLESLIKSYQICKWMLCAAKEVLDSIP